MNTRFLTVLTVASILASSPGCSGFKNFVFGRGARCGLCSKLPLPRFRQPAIAPAPCGPTCPPTPVYVPGPVYAPETCGTCYSPAADCGCGESMGYAPMIGVPSAGDPYLQQGGLPSGSAQLYGPGQSYNGNLYGQPSIGSGMMQGDGFENRSSNRVDYDGAKILSEEPLPSGATPMR